MIEVEKELAICDELHRLVELNDASLDGELAEAEEAFSDSAHRYYPELLRRLQRLRELLAGVDGFSRWYECGMNSRSIPAGVESLTELRQLLGGGGAG